MGGARPDRLGAFSRLLRDFKAGVSDEGRGEFGFDAQAVASAEVARDHDTGVVFLVDEMQFLERSELEATAAAMHQMSQRSLPIALVGSVHRDSLIKKGLVYAPDHGLIDFTVPHFAAFMRRRYPFAGDDAGGPG